MKTTKQQLYFIPGTMCNEQLWSLIIPALAEQFEVTLLSPPCAQNLEAMVQQITEQLPNYPVHLIGFSLGGYLASQLAINHPHRVKKLFIIANSSGALPASEILQRQEAIKFVDQHGYGGMSRRKAASIIDANHHNKDAIISIIRQMDKALGKTVFLNQMHVTTDRPDLYLQFYDISIPTTFYYSENDRLIDPQWIEKCVNNKPHFKQIVESGDGHMLPLEQPENLIKYLNDWS